MLKGVLNEGDSNANDFEKWYARHEDATVDCVMGKKTGYWRRKADRPCFVGNPYQELKKVEEACPCTELDYEWYGT